MPDILRKAGLNVECHSSYFKREEDDHVWIPQCAKNNWIIVTSDKGTETDPVNRTAVFESEAMVFILEEGTSQAVSWAASIIVSRTKIYQTVLEQKRKGPFYMTISKETGLLVKALRRPCLVPGSPTREMMVIHDSPGGVPPKLPEEGSESVGGVAS